MAGVAAPHTGTTIVGCVFNGGVVLGADGRVSTGQYISNRASNKIAPLSDRTFLLRSGSAADTQIISDYVTYYAERLETELGRSPTVSAVATLVRQIAVITALQGSADTNAKFIMLNDAGKFKGLHPFRSS